MSVSLGDVVSIYDVHGGYESMGSHIVEFISLEPDSDDISWRATEGSPECCAWHEDYLDWLDCSAELLI